MNNCVVTDNDTTLVDALDSDKFDFQCFNEHTCQVRGTSYEYDVSTNKVNYRGLDYRKINDTTWLETKHVEGLKSTSFLVLLRDNLVKDTIEVLEAPSENDCGFGYIPIKYCEMDTVSVDQ